MAEAQIDGPRGPSKPEEIIGCLVSSVSLSDLQLDHADYQLESLAVANRVDAALGEVSLLQFLLRHQFVELHAPGLGQHGEHLGDECPYCFG